MRGEFSIIIGISVCETHNYIKIEFFVTFLSPFICYYTDAETKALQKRRSAAPETEKIRKKVTVSETGCGLI